MGNKKVIYNKKIWRLLSIVFAVLLCVDWLVYCYKNYTNETVNIAQIGSAIAAIISSVISIITFLALDKKKTNENKVNSTQEKNSQKEESPGQRKTWFNFDHKWFFLAIVMVLFFVGSLIFTILKIVNDDGIEEPLEEIIIGEQNKDSLFVVEQQQKYNNLVANYKNRMEVPIVIKNAPKSLKKDSLVVSQIVQLLEQNPALDSISKFQYIETYNNRVDSAIKIIFPTVFLPDWDSSELKCKVAILKKIEQMKINP